MPPSAQRTLSELGRAGISLDSVTDKLVEDGVQLFADAADKLLAAVAKKRGEILDRQIDKQKLALGHQLEKKVDEIAEDWRKHGNIRKLWQRDKSLWTDADEDRWLGWLDSAGDDEIAGYARFAHDIKRDGFKDAVLLGMGGSSLGPEVLATTFGQNAGWPRLRILDSTVPAQIKALEADLDLAKTLFIVSSKSGSTTEPNVLTDYFFKRVARHASAPTKPAGISSPSPIPARRWKSARRSKASGTSFTASPASAAAIRCCRRSASCPRRLPASMSPSLCRPRA